MTNVSVIIPAFGRGYAQIVERAVASVESQTVPVECLLITKGTNLGMVRNSGAQQAIGDWLIFLDADDYLDPRYVEKMLEGSADLRYPALATEDGEGSLLAPVPLWKGNYMVIGSMVRKDLFLDCGGFDIDYPVFEDWALWCKMWTKYDISIEPIAEAIYRVGGSGRNIAMSPRERDRFFTIIRDRFFPLPMDEEDRICRGL